MTALCPGCGGLPREAVEILELIEGLVPEPELCVYDGVKDRNLAQEIRALLTDREPPCLGPSVGCEGCGLPYAGPAWADVVIPDENWNRLGKGLLCFNCMTRALVEDGQSNVPVLVASGPYVCDSEKWRMLGWEHGRKVGLEAGRDELRQGHEIPGLLERAERMRQHILTKVVGRLCEPNGRVTGEWGCGMCGGVGMGPRDGTRALDTIKHEPDCMLNPLEPPSHQGPSDGERMNAIEKWGGAYIIDWSAGGARGNPWTVDPCDQEGEPHPAIGRYEGATLRDAIDTAMRGDEHSPCTAQEPKL
jgi:hypothetical protein